METKRKATEQDQGLDEQHDNQGPDEQHGGPDGDVNAVEVFKEFHTSKKKGLSDAAREAVVTCKYLNLLSLKIAIIHQSVWYPIHCAFVISVSSRLITTNALCLCILYQQYAAEGLCISCYGLISWVFNLSPLPLSAT